MSTRVTIEIEVDEEFADPGHDTGLTEEGHDVLSQAVSNLGTIASGPDRV